MQMQMPLDQNQNRTSSDAHGIELDESTEARIERLGRERPSCFSSIWAESAFCFSVLMSQILTVGNSRYSRYRDRTFLLITLPGIFHDGIKCHPARAERSIRYP